MGAVIWFVLSHMEFWLAAVIGLFLRLLQRGGDRVQVYPPR